MRVLITGASGYIGGWVTQRLLELGGDVHLASRALPATLPPGARPVRCDMTCEGWTEALPDVDAVVHLAQSRRYRQFPDGARDMLRVNVDATLELLEWARQRGVKKVVLASSGNVYAQQRRPLVESDVCRPDGMYGATKLASELVAEPYSQFFTVTSARLFGVYGPRQASMMIPALIERVRTGEPIELADNVGIHLTPLYVADCAEALAQLTLRAVHDGYEAFNVAGAERVHFGEITAMLEQLLQRAAVTRHTASTARYLMADIGKIQRALGWSPSVSMRDGLARTVLGDIGAPERVTSGAASATPSR